MTASRVLTHQVHVCARAALPARWAAELVRAMVDDLPAQVVDLAQERVVALGEGVRLAHVRTAAVGECLVAAYKASDVDSEPEADWLWLAVLMPESEVARHLGWLAHLAAMLRDEDTIRRLKMATSGPAVAGIISTGLAGDGRRHSRSGAHPASRRTATTTATHRMVVAVLKGDEAVDHLLTLFVEHEVQGATIIDGVGMGEHLAAHLSLFAGFRMAFKSVGKSHVVMTVVPAARSDEVLELARQVIVGGGGTGGTGVAWAIDLAGFIAPGGG
jgi:mannitol/fructose-specific phosphotransferase system IIA component (Ntr-type)